MIRPTRTGTLLPTLLLPLALLALVTFASTTAQVTSHQEATRAAQGLRTLAAAESALERLRDQLRDNPLGNAAAQPATLPLPGDTTILATPRHDGVHAHAVATRPHPYLTWLVGTATLPNPAHTTQIERHVERALWLVPPAIDLLAAIASRTTLHTATSAQVDGTDLPAPNSPCAPARERHPLPAVRAGLPLHADTSALRQRLRQLGKAQLHPAPPAMRDNAWDAAAIQPPPLGLQGTHHWRGLLIVDGDLHLVGSLTVHGVLLVLGRLLGEGPLLVQGAALLLARDGGTSTLGPNARITFDQCAAQLALATLATIRRGPVGHWGTSSRHHAP